MPANPPATRRSPARLGFILAALFLLLILAALMRVYIGTNALGWPADVAILRERSLLLGEAAVVGVALAVSGVAMQALLRNPLAEPFILGLSTGAGVGIMAQWMFSYALSRQLGASYQGALIGSFLSAAIVYLASRRRGMIDPLGLLLVGVVLSTINGSLIMLFNYLVTGNAGIKQDISVWMIGNIKGLTQSHVLLTVALVTAAGLLLLVWQARAMDVGAFSDMEALSLGVNLPRLRTVLFLVAGAMTAGATVVAGPMAFVGLICPHVARLMLGPSHRSLLIASAILGATLLILADVASSSLALGLDIGKVPVGIFTSMIGGPVFLWMLRPQLGRGNE